MVACEQPLGPLVVYQPGVFFVAVLVDAREKSGAKSYYPAFLL
jgi:hypothetical protein